MLTLIIVSFGVCLVGAITDPTQLCDQLVTLDCKLDYIKGERDETVCGTNGVTYENFCYYGQARCSDNSITVSDVGACPTSGSTTPGGTVMVSTVSVSSAPGSTGSPTASTTVDHILVAFCQNKDKITCDTTLAPICGSDKQFYLNTCEYSKAYCGDNTLTSKDISFCTGRK